jgi:hypothetical protein
MKQNNDPPTPSKCEIPEPELEDIDWERILAEEDTEKRKNLYEIYSGMFCS